jgi:hypothetical protein
LFDDNLREQTTAQAIKSVDQVASLGNTVLLYNQRGCLPLGTNSYNLTIFSLIPCNTSAKLESKSKEAQTAPNDNCVSNGPLKRWPAGFFEKSFCLGVKFDSHSGKVGRKKCLYNLLRLSIVPEAFQIIRRCVLSAAYLVHSNTIIVRRRMSSKVWGAYIM